MAVGLLVDIALYGAAERGVGGPRVLSTPVSVRRARGLMLAGGAGPATVILASPLIRARSYLSLLRVLARDGLAIVVEMPGSGAGSRLPKPWLPSDYADWAAELLDQLNIGPVTLIGHSNSGAVALLTSPRCDKVERLVLVGSIGARRKLGTWRVMVARVIDGFKEPLLGLRGWWHVAYNLLLHPRSFAHQARVSSNANLLEEARRVRVPTILAWGVWDGTMPLDCARRFEASIKQSRVVVGSGSHDWLITRPKSFARLIATLGRTPR